MKLTNKIDKDMNTTKGNKLIAEFMGVSPVGSGASDKEPNWYDGWELQKAGLPFKCGIMGNGTHELPFHSSWDWLMPVVEKIENESDSIIEIELDNAHISGDFKLSVHEHSKIESVYTAVVKFIQWYNQQK